MNRELFIYWRVAPAQLPQATAAVLEWQTGLRLAHAGLQARLLSRCDSGAAQATLMETYADAAGLPPSLQSAIVEQGAQLASRWCQGDRHVEVFESVC